MPVLMVHGALADHALWDRIVPGLETVADLIRPDLPIGAHRTVVTRRDLLHPEAIADALVGVLATFYRSNRIRRSFMGAGLLLNHPVDDAVVKPWLGTFVERTENRKDVRAFLRGCEPRLAHAAAEQLTTFPQPVLIAWSRGDRLFPGADAERLATMIPDCELHWIDGCRTFSMVDRPDELVAIIRPFLEQLATI